MLDGLRCGKHAGIEGTPFREKRIPPSEVGFFELLLVALLMLTRLRVAVIAVLSALTGLLRLLTGFWIALSTLLASLTRLLILLAGGMGTALLTGLFV
jgi:hypothetical protein